MSFWLRGAAGMAVAFALLHPLRTIAQGGPPAGPPIPYEDVGACPFEGCTYREWAANASVVARSDRRADAPTVFTLAKGDRVRAITGIVTVLKAGRAQFRRATAFWTTAGTLHAEAGDTIYILTSKGEGFSSGWFKGRFFDSFEASNFYAENCDRFPRCQGPLLERPQTVWWVRIENQAGVTGWTNEPQKFDNRDRFAGLTPEETWLAGSFSNLLESAR